VAPGGNSDLIFLVGWGQDAGRYGTSMLDLRKRLMIPLITVLLSLATVACATNDRPGNTSPGESSTTEPVGS
jgi:hypothetical protein